MREKIIEIIRSRTSILHHETELEVADQILKTLIESLPEEKPENLRIYDNHGWNMYRNEVINLLRGN
jgi:hypothetical protein